ARMSCNNDALNPLIVVDLTDQVGAAPIREEDVDEKDVGYVRRECTPRRRQVTRTRNLEAIVAHQFSECIKRITIVLDDEGSRLGLHHQFPRAPGRRISHRVPVSGLELKFTCPPWAPTIAWAR